MRARVEMMSVVLLAFLWVLPSARAQEADIRGAWHADSYV